MSAAPVQAGQTLVVGLDGHATVQQAHEVRAELEARLPGVDVVVISGCTSLVVLPGSP